MQKMQLIFVLLFSPLCGAEQKLPPQQSASSAEASFSLPDAVLEEYQAGKYQSFLEKQHQEYEEARKKWQHDPMLEKRKQLSSLVYDPIKEEGKERKNSYKENLLALEKKTDKELLEICLAYPNDPFCCAVKEMLTFAPGGEEKEALLFLDSIAHKHKGEGKTPLENKLISIDTEFWLKSLTLDVSFTEHKIDPTSHQKGRFVLGLEKLSQMKQACKEEQDGQLFAPHIEKGFELYPRMESASFARKKLLSLGEGKEVPQNEAEVKMQKVMKSYVEGEKKLISSDR